MALKFPDTAVPMGDFPAAMAEHIEFSDGENLQEKLDNGSLGGGAVKNYLRLKGTVGYDPQMVEITPSLVQSVLTNATPETIEGRWILEEAETNTEIFDTDGNFSLPALEKITFTKLDDYKVVGITDITSTAISCRAITDIDVPFEFILEWKEENDAGHIELTQAEYDALPEEEKMNGAIYFITDAIGGGEDISIDDNTISTETTWSSEKIFSELNENYAIFEGTVGESYYSTNISAEDIYSGSSLYGGWTIDKVKSSTEMAMIINKYNAASNKKIINNFYDYLDVQVNEYDIYLEDTAKDNGGKPYKFALLWSNEGGNEDTLIVNCTISAETDENIEIINYDGNYTQIKEAIENGTKVELRVLYNYSTLYILEPSRIDTNGYIYFNSINNTSSVTVSIKEPSIINFDLVDLSSSSEEGIATYTSLAELGLTAPVTVGDIFNAMPDKSMAVIACEDVTEHITDVPMHYGVLTIKKSAVGRFSIDFQNSLASSPCNVKKWIGTLKGDDGTGLYWREVAYKENLSIYKSLSELGLDTTATLKDITRAMEKSSMIAIKVDAMANQSEYNNITQGTVTIYKIEDARIQAIMTEKSTGRTWVGTLGGENTIIGWKELRSDPPFYRIVTQGIWGYFKFKPTSTGKEQPLRISVTDNYGGMINISGATPSGSQYKPFKCIRLSYGEFSDYDAIKVANNKMLKLFYYDGYFYLKVATYTTCTFTGLTEAPTYVETFDDTDAEQIPIRSVFDTPYNNGYADPSIMAIGDIDSTDGVVKTLVTLGFTGDIMTWDNGEYRVSHVSGLTNFPAEITEEKPGFRLEHYDVKKWGSNHNPHHSTYGCRQSILHYKGSIFVRYQESSATAGVITFDTGWQKLSKTVIIDKLADLGLTTPCTTAEVANALKRSKPQNNAAIAIIDIAPNQVSDVPSDYGLLHIETIGYDRISIRFDAVGSSNYKGSWIGKISGSSGTFSGVSWDKLVTESNTLGGKEVKMLEINLSDDAYQPTSTAGVITMPIPNLSTTAKVIKAEGYYEDVDGDYFIVSANASGGAGTVKFASSKWSIAVNPVLGGRNKGFAKIYYIE